MDTESLDKLMLQALYENSLIVECPQCYTDLTIEPDSDSAWCDVCNKVVKGVNPLIRHGLI